MFADLILKHSKTLKIKQFGSGSVDKGFYNKGIADEYEGEITLFPMSAKELNKYEAGTYTAQDVTLFVPDPFEVKRLDDGEAVFITLKDGDQVIDGDDVFTIKTESDFSTISDFKKYAGKKGVIKKDAGS